MYPRILLVFALLTGVFALLTGSLAAADAKPIDPTLLTATQPKLEAAAETIFWRRLCP
jgi:hypothetical protein